MYYYLLILPSAETPDKYIQSTLKRRKRQVCKCPSQPWQGPWSPECPECRMRQRCSIRKIKRSPEIKVNDFMTYIDDKNCSNYFLAALTSFSKISFHSFLVFSDSNLRSIPPPRLKLTVRHLRLSVSDIVLDLTGGPATTLVTYIVKKSE